MERKQMKICIPYREVRGKNEIGENSYFLVDIYTKKHDKISPRDLYMQLGYPCRYYTGRNSDHKIYEIQLTMRYMQLSFARIAYEIFQEDMAAYHSKMLTADMVYADKLSAGYAAYMDGIDFTNPLFEEDYRIFSTFKKDMTIYFYSADNALKKTSMSDYDRMVYLIIAKQRILHYIMFTQSMRTCNAGHDLTTARMHDPLVKWEKARDRVRKQGDLCCKELCNMHSEVGTATLNVIVNRVDTPLWSLIDAEIKEKHYRLWLSVHPEAKKEAKEEKPKAPAKKKTKKTKPKAKPGTSPSIESLEALKAKFAAQNMSKRNKAI